MLRPCVVRWGGSLQGVLRTMFFGLRLLSHTITKGKGTERRVNWAAKFFSRQPKALDWNFAKIAPITLDLFELLLSALIWTDISVFPYSHPLPFWDSCRTHGNIDPVRPGSLSGYLIYIYRQYPLVRLHVKQVKVSVYWRPLLEHLCAALGLVKV